jgi:nucleoside-diphosphate-sugar epimerase
MRIFIAGATGAVGQRLVPLLVQRGHEVAGTTRSPGRAAAIRSAGAQPVVVEPLDRDAMVDAVRKARPEVVVHELTALGGKLDLRKFEEAFAETNRLRTEGTDILLEAARAAGARRFVAQSFGATPYARRGGPVKTEDDPLDDDPPGQMATTFDAIKYLERAVFGPSDLEGIALRYGGFYGPGQSIGEGGQMVEEVRRRRFPIVGDGSGVWSFIHIDDAASATVAAIERGRPGIYNVVDDEPAPLREWLPELARVIGAKRPRRVPVWLARRLAGDHVVMMATEMRGASNEKIKRELGWAPHWASWRRGFHEGLSSHTDDRPQSAAS